MFFPEGEIGGVEGDQPEQSEGFENSDGHQSEYAPDGDDDSFLVQIEIGRVHHVRLRDYKSMVEQERNEGDAVGDCMDKHFPQTEVFLPRPVEKEWQCEGVAFVVQESKREEAGLQGKISHGQAKPEQEIGSGIGIALEVKRKEHGGAECHERGCAQAFGCGIFFSEMEIDGGHEQKAHEQWEEDIPVSSEKEDMGQERGKYSQLKRIPGGKIKRRR